jgi:putative tricarboxylic transport membrane protein
MTDDRQGRAAFRIKSAELVVAALFFILGAIVIYDSRRLGAGWAADGPRPGYFPFYIGLLICISAAINFVRGLLLKREQDKTFVQVGQLKIIYTAGALFIAFFMRWLGKYAWWKVAAVSLGTVAVFYLVFEIWFKVPLPKGIVERLLGLD